MTIPKQKMLDIAEVLESWKGKQGETLQEMQSLFGLLQFWQASPPPPSQNIHQPYALSLGFKKDLKLFLDLLPQYTGIRIMRKELVECQEEIELDACLTGCGAFVGSEYYSEVFPEKVVEKGHTIAHLELLNVVVAVKT